MRCILFPSPAMDQVLCLPQRTTVVVAAMTRWVKLEPGSPFLRLQTPGSRPRLSPRTQAAARRWGSGSGVTQSPGCQVLYQPCSSSHPADLLHIHLASSTCQPFLVRSCKTPAGKNVDCEIQTLPGCSSVKVLGFCFHAESSRCYRSPPPGQDARLPAGNIITRAVIQSHAHRQPRA